MMMPFFKKKSRDKTNILQDADELPENKCERGTASPARDVEEETPKPSRKVLSSLSKLVGIKWDKLTNKSSYEQEEDEKKDIACSLSYDKKPSKLRGLFTRRKKVETYKEKETLLYDFPTSSRLEEQQDNLNEPTTYVREDDPADCMDGAYGGYDIYDTTFDVWNKTEGEEDTMSCDSPLDPSKWMPHTRSGGHTLRQNINIWDEALNLHSCQEKLDPLRSLNVASTSRENHFEITPLKTKRSFCFNDAFTNVNRGQNKYMNNTIFMTTDSLVVYDDETKTYEPLIYQKHDRQTDLNWDIRNSGRVLPSFSNSDIISERPNMAIDSDFPDTLPGIDDNDDFDMSDHTFLVNDCYLDEENKHLFKMYKLSKSNPQERLGLILTVNVCQISPGEEELRFVVMDIEDGVAKRDGRIKLGDEVLNVNGELLRGNKDLFHVQECLNKWMPMEKGIYSSYIVVGRSKLNSLSFGNKLPSWRHSVATSNAVDKSNFRMMEGLKYQGTNSTDQDDSDDGEVVLVTEEGTIFPKPTYSGPYPSPELGLLSEEEPEVINPDVIRLREEIARFSFREYIDGHKPIPHIESIPENFIEVTPAYIANSFYHFKAIFYKRLRSICLGFSIIGGVDSPTEQMGIYVKKVFRVGQAAKYRLLEKGDQILGVNGVSVAGMSHYEVVSLMKKPRYGRVELIVSRRIKWPVFNNQDNDV